MMNKKGHEAKQDAYPAELRGQMDFSRMKQKV